MKIELTNGATVDTDKMSDKEAAISEAVSNLYKLCEQYNVTAFCRVLVEPKKFIGLNRFVKIPQKRMESDYYFLMESIARFADETSGGKIALMLAKPDDSQAQE